MNSNVQCNQRKRWKQLEMHGYIDSKDTSAKENRKIDVEDVDVEIRFTGGRANH